MFQPATSKDGGDVRFAHFASNREHCQQRSLHSGVGYVASRAKVSDETKGALESCLVEKGRMSWMQNMTEDTTYEETRPRNYHFIISFVELKNDKTRLWKSHGLVMILPDHSKISTQHVSVRSELFCGTPNYLR